MNVYIVQVCWVVISPLFLVVIFLAACYDWHQPSYGSVSYPPWAHTIGWVLTMVSVGQIPFWLLIMSLVSIMEGGWGSWTTFYPTQSWLDRRSKTEDLTFIYKSDVSLPSYDSFLRICTTSPPSGTEDTTSPLPGAEHITSSLSVAEHSTSPISVATSSIREESFLSLPGYRSVINLSRHGGVELSPAPKSAKHSARAERSADQLEQQKLS